MRAKADSGASRWAVGQRAPPCPLRKPATSSPAAPPSALTRLLVVRLVRRQERGHLRGEWRHAASHAFVTCGGAMFFPSCPVTWPSSMHLRNLQQLQPDWSLSPRWYIVGIPSIERGRTVCSTYSAQLQEPNKPQPARGICKETMGHVPLATRSW